MSRTLGEALARARTRLPRDEADHLASAALAVDRAILLAFPERPVDADAWARLLDWIERRARGEPLAYLTGRKGFWDFELVVTPAVLVPRPETETLVNAALARIPEDAPWHLVDLGTGSGAIAIALARERPACRVIAVDRSRAALAVAEENRRRLQVPNLALRRGDWFAPLAGTRAHLICANPPYVAPGDPHLEEGSLPFEPPEALVAEDGGMADLAHLVCHAPDHLHPGGWLLLEHGHDQGAAVRRLFRERGFQAVETHRDLAGVERVTLGRWGDPPLK